MFSRIDRSVLLFLADADGPIEMFKMHEANGLSPGEIAESLARLAILGIVERRGMSAVLTPRGREICVSNASLVWNSDASAPWKAIPAEMLVSHEDKPLLYCPSLVTLHELLDNEKE